MSKAIPTAHPLVMKNDFMNEAFNNTLTFAINNNLSLQNRKPEVDILSYGSASLS